MQSSSTKKNGVPFLLYSFSPSNLVFCSFSTRRRLHHNRYGYHRPETAMFLAFITFLFLATLSKGLCLGTTLTSSSQVDKAGCVELCQVTTGCEYYSYDNSDGYCGIYSNCPIVDPTCLTCTSGENECPPVLCSVPGGCEGFLVLYTFLH